MSTDAYYNKKEYTKVGGFRKKAILDFVEKQNPRILDIGCSDGEMGWILSKEKGAHVIGVDISKNIIEKAKTRLDEAYVVDIEKDASEWPEGLTKKNFDYIIISEVLEHLLEPDILMEKIKSLTHKDTEVIITVPNLLFWKNRLKILSGSFDYEEKGLMDRGHIHFFSWKSLKDLVWQSGFELVRFRNNFPTRGTKQLGALFNGLFSYQFAVKIRKKKIAIYTVIMGAYDELQDPDFIDRGCDYICFSDQEHRSKVWRSIVLEPIFADDLARSSREPKILAHKYLSDYEYSIYVDGNIRVAGRASELVGKYLVDSNMAVYSHGNLKYSVGHTKLIKLLNFFTGHRFNKERMYCIYRQAEHIKMLAEHGKRKEDPALIDRQIKAYRDEGYPESNGLIAGGVLVRRHNEMDVKRNMEDWWNQLLKYSRRDQMSFNYVAWKNKFNFVYMEGDIRRNKYFRWQKHSGKTK